MNVQLKNMITSILDLCDSLNQYNPSKKMSLKELCGFDFLRFALYLSASDGAVKQTEADFLNTYLGWNLTTADWVKFIKEENIYSESFETTTPISLVVFVKADNDYCRKSFKLPEVSMGDLLISTFEGLGRELVSSDRDINNQELEDLNIYISNLKKYVRKNSVRASVDSDSYDDNEEELDEFHERVSFLGKEYILPYSYEINSYRTLMDALAKAYTDVMNHFQSDVDEVTKSEAKYQNQGFCIQLHFWDDISGTNDYIDNILEDMRLAGVDVCPRGDNCEYYGRRTKGYQALEKTTDALVDIIRKLYYQKEHAIEYGQQVAYRNAASNITGMGYGIITNSAVDLLFYNAVSNATLKSQAKKADRQFERESGASARAALSVYARQMHEVYYDQYVPVAKKCIDLWASEITERALAFEVRNEHPVYPEIKKYNLQESEKVLSTVSASSTTESIISILRKAFELCPFNLNIYVKAAELNVLDEETAMVFNHYLHDLHDYDFRFKIHKELERHCKKNLRDRELLKRYCRLFKVLLYGKTEKDIYEKLLSDKISEITTGYKELNDILLNNRVVSFVQKNLHYGQSYISFTGNTEEDLIKEVIKYIDSFTDAVTLQFLLDEELVDSSLFPLGKTFEAEEIIATYREKLLGTILQYYQKVVASAAQYEIAKEIFSLELQEKKDTLAALRSERNSLGIFKGNQKKLLDEQITTLSAEVTECEKKAPVFIWPDA